MTNIFLYFATVIVYSVLLLCVSYRKGQFNQVKKDAKKTLCFWAILCLPVNINGEVSTVFGNATSEKGVYSVWSLFQEAKGDTFSVIGLTAYQDAGGDAQVGFGFVAYQEADKGDALVGFGLPFYQRAGNAAIILIGTVGCQNAKIAILGVGVVGYQKAIDRAYILFGLVGYQNAGRRAETMIAMALYQKVEMLGRSFAVFSELEVLPPKDKDAK